MFGDKRIYLSYGNHKGALLGLVYFGIATTLCEVDLSEDFKGAEKYSRVSSFILLLIT